MTQAVGFSAFPRAVRRLARPSPAVRFGLKLGTAVSASVWIAFATALPWGLTIWTTVLFVAQPNVGASVKKGLTRIVGSAASALVSIAIYGLFAQQPPLLLASLCGVLALAVYGMTGPRYQYAWLVFGFTTILILVKAMSGSDPIETLSFERSTLTALGVLIVFVADALFWPVRAEEELRESLANRSRRLGETLKRHLEGLASAREAEEPEPPPSSPLIEQLGLADEFQSEIGATPARVQGLARLALLTEGLASRVRQLRRVTERNQSPLDSPLRAPLARLGQSLDAALAEASHCLAADRAPEPFAQALESSLAGFEGERLAQVESLLREGATGRGEAEREAPLSALASGLNDVVGLLGRIEEALLVLVKEDGEPAAERRSEAAPGKAGKWFRPDTIRLQLGLRAGIAGGGVIVAMLAMGWSLEEDVLAMIMAPIVAFILAGASATRGAGTLVGVGLASGVLGGWLIADLASVFLFNHLDRMPLSLLYPFAIAGGAGYLIVRGSPLGTLGALFGMLTALLPIYIGDAPPRNVEIAYGLACGILLGEAAGLIAQRFLWPRTAMQIFTERAAAQLDVCLRALGSGEDAETERDANDLVSVYAKQLTLLGQLHAQAHAEPVERALEDTRRAELLALTQELFDASLRVRRWLVRQEAAVPEREAAAVAPLREALARQDAALVASLKAAGDALRDIGPGPDSSLGDARAAVDAQIDALRGQAELAPLLDARRTSDFMARVAASRRLVESQLQLEKWLTDWQRAAPIGVGAEGR